MGRRGVRGTPGKAKRDACGLGAWDESAGPGDDDGWITQARQRLGEEPAKEVFARAAVPVGTVDMLRALRGCGG